MGEPTVAEVIAKLRVIRESWEFAPGAPWPGYEHAADDIDELLAELDSQEDG